MGTFVTDPTSELFEDKEPAPGLSRRQGWTDANILEASEINALRDACYDLREAVIDARENGGAPLGNSSPADLGTSSPGGSTFAARADHVHAHGNLAGGTLHASATDATAGFMSAADKTKLDGVSGTNTGDVTLGTANGLSLVGQALSLAVAGASAGAMSAADKTKLDGIAAGATAGVTTMAAVGSVPNANGASISTTTLTLQPADASNPGLVTTGAQTIAGVKTFSSSPSVPGLTMSGTSTNTITSATSATGSADTAFLFNALANLDTSSAHGDLIAKFQRNNGTNVYHFSAGGRIWVEAGANNAAPGFMFTTPSGGGVLFRLAGGSGEQAQLIAQNASLTTFNIGLGSGATKPTTNIGPDINELSVSDTAVSVGGGCNFTVDTNVISANASTNRVGINKTTPDYPLDVVGDIYSSTNVKTAYDVVVSAYRDATTMPMTTSDYTVVNFNTTEVDTHTAIANATTDWNFTVPAGAGGKYVISYGVTLEPNTSTPFNAIYAIRVGSTRVRLQYMRDVVELQTIAGTHILSLSAGNVVRIEAWHNHASATIWGVAGSSWASIHRLPGA